MTDTPHYVYYKPVCFAGPDGPALEALQEEVNEWVKSGGAAITKMTNEWGNRLGAQLLSVLVLEG